MKICIKLASYFFAFIAMGFALPAYSLPEADRNFLNTEACRYLRAWCSDAWCAGDFQHEWQSFYFDEEKGLWALDFVTFLRFKEGYTASKMTLRADYPAEPAQQVGIESQASLFVRSQCYFPNSEPSVEGVYGPVVVALNASGAVDHQKGVALTALGSEQLVGCTAKVEAKLRHLLAAQK